MAAQLGAAGFAALARQDEASSAKRARVSPSAVAVVVALGAAGCDSLLGADFEDATFDPSGPGGGGAPGSPGTAGSESAGGPEGAGAASGAGGSSGGGGSGGNPGRTHLWSKRFGDAAEQRVRGIAVDSQGNVLVAGYFAGSIDFGGGELTSAGAHDIFVAKLDADGEHVWSFAFGSAGVDGARAIAVGPADDVILTGAIGGPVDFGGGTLDPNGAPDVFALRLDASGAHVWSARFGDTGENQVAYGVAFSAAMGGMVALTGDCDGLLDFGVGPLACHQGSGIGDVFVATLDAAGQPLWSKAFPDSGKDALQTGEAVAVGGDGAVLVVGSSDDQIDLGGGAIIGDVAFVAKFEPTGEHLWSKQLGATNDYGAGNVALAANGDVLVASSFLGPDVDLGDGVVVDNAGQMDVLVARYSAGGQALWGTRIGGEGFDGSPLLAATAAADEIFACGRFAGSFDVGKGPIPYQGENDVWLAKLAGDGDVAWAVGFGDVHDQRCEAIAVDPGGAVVIGADIEGSPDFGGGPLATAGGYDIAVVKYGP